MPHLEIEFQDLEFYETLGRGSAGSVYKGLWRSKEKIVALKKLNVLEKEVEVLSSLSHRNIIQFFGAVTIAPNFCIVTEYAELGSLYDYLRGNSIEFKQILQWAKEIAVGMNYLHHEAPISVLHRDLKSKNVVISADLTAKLCDFGSSKFHPHTTNLTLVGTFAWMAPEVIQQLPVTAACDVFSYSVVLWELLTHEVPYRGLEGLQVAWLVVAKEQRLTIPSSCPAVFAELMQKCWRQQPQDRLNFKQILLELDSILGNVNVVEKETDHFLKQKDEWKLEIESRLAELKNMETALSGRELEIRKKEQQLAAREKHLESIVSTSSRQPLHDEDNPEPHDAEQWSEQEVVDWLFTLTRPGSRGGGVTGGVTWKDTDGPGYLAQYATLFERHHITGKSLFLLTSDDLMQMGVLSTGHRKELLEELENMRRNNYRLLHFPPLQQQATPKAAVLESVTENLTVIFACICRDGLTNEDHKCKYLVDFEGVWQGIVQTVQWVFSSSMPPDIVTLTQPPYLMPEWRVGPHVNTVECIITYRENVQKPRETSHQFSARPGGGDTQELCVKLNLHKVSTATSKKATPNSQQVTPQKSNFKRNPSSPQLSGVWARPAMRPLNLTSQSTVTTDRRKSKEIPLSFTVGGSQSPTPTDSLESPGVTLRNPRPMNRSSNSGLPTQPHPFHHSISGPLDQATPCHRPSPRPRSENYSSRGFASPSNSLSRSNNSSQESGLNESLSSSSSKEGSWSKVVGKRNRQQQGGGAGGQYQRSQSSTHYQQAASSRGRRGRGGMGVARKPHTVPGYRQQ